MKDHATIGDYYAALLKAHLDQAIDLKLAQTSAFKKTLAGIATADDARRKGYAPSHMQVDELKACIREEANRLYATGRFRELDTQKAVQEIVGELLRHLDALNTRWRSSGLFCFDSESLADLATEAAGIISAEHEAAKRHFS